MAQKILIVDDQFTIRYLVEHQLKKEGFETFMAKDGPSALEMADRQRPDLIVLDVMMPDMSGFDVLQQLKDNPDTAHIPVVFLTALSSKEDKLRAFKMGAEDYLIKPFQADEFVAHVTAALRSAGSVSSENYEKTKKRGSIVAFYSPKGGVGTTTLTIQMGEFIALHEGKQVVLIDLALPLGGLAPLLKLYTTRHVVSLLKTAVEEYNLDTILRFAQNHRSNLKVIPAPGHYLSAKELPQPHHLEPILDILTDAGYQVQIDLGTALTPLTLAAMQKAGKTFVLTSGQPEANLQVETFLASAEQMGLDPRRILPVINELYGESEETKLARIPTARIPYASKNGRTRLWLTEQALQKMAAVALI
ncbi:MAG: response regulator [Ardenticatenaceae bacterium]|nr:response regulator [Ardenticatenaceae bacterium]